MDDNISHQPVQPQVHIDKFALQARLEQFKDEQNLPLGILGGMIGGALGAALWAAITYFTETQLGLVAIFVGILVGYGVRLLGKGIDKIFGGIGAILALISILVGNFFAVMGFLARALELGYLETLLNFNYSMIGTLFVETFSPMDLIFYAIAIYEGYRFSFRRIPRSELFAGITTTSNAIIDQE